MSLSYSFGRHRPKPRRVMQVRSCGVLGSGPPLSGRGSANVEGSPIGIHSISSISSADSGWTPHARWFLYLVYSTWNINVDFMRLFHCINRIRMFGSGWAGSAQTPGESTRGKGRKEDWRRERAGWPHIWTPKISDRSPPLHVGYTVARRQNKQASKASFCIGLKV